MRVCNFFLLGFFFLNFDCYLSVTFFDCGQLTTSPFLLFFAIDTLAFFTTGLEFRVELGF